MFTKEEILEKAKEGIWVLQRNVAAEKAFPAELLSPEKIYTPVKLIYDEKNSLFEVISFSGKGTPCIYAYSADQVDFEEGEDGLLVLNILGKSEFYDSYPEPEETREEFIEKFFRCWNLSPEEYEKYGIKKDVKSLPVLGIDRLAR